MDLNPQAKSSDPGPSDTSEMDELVAPISCQPGPEDAQSKENGPKFYPSLPLLWAPTSPLISDVHQQIGAGKNSDHTITIPEPHFCRICVEEDVDDDADDLIELRCSCKGHMSRMHRNCILKWFGMRMILDRLFNCELCNTVLHPETQLVVVRAVEDYEGQGRDILLEALTSELAPYPSVGDLESAATYHELVDLIHAHPREYMLPHIIIAARATRDVPTLPQPPRCDGAAVCVLLGTTVIVAGTCYLLDRLFHGLRALQ